MKILADIHHRDLYFSLHQLLVERLGFQLYRPMGIEWEKEGWWKIWACNNPDMSHREGFIIPGHGINEVCTEVEEGLWETTCQYHGYKANGITLDRFKQEKFDIIFPSYPAFHYDLWKTLRDQFQPSAKFVCHFGNIDISHDTDNAIHSVPLLGKVKNSVLVHQELNTKLYKFTPIPLNGVNITAIISPYQFPELWESYRDMLPEFNWAYYGQQSPDGWLEGLEPVSKAMQAAGLGWSTKLGGGLGHTNMGWMFSGRPLVTNMSEHTRYNSGGTALELFEPGVTCIDLDSGSKHENGQLIRKWMNPEVGQKHGDICHKRFTNVINYEQEAEDAKKFFERLI